MEITMQSSILIVGDLDRSIEFYASVFGFPLITRRGQVAAVLVEGADRSQVLILRKTPARQATHPGRGSIGVGVLGFEVASVEELDQVHEKLDQRHAVLGRRRTDRWESIIGIDPDRIELSVSTGLTGRPIEMKDWRTNLDEMVEAITQ